MTATPQVSVVLPTFRRPTFLERAIESVRDQRFDGWELLVVDDNDPASEDRAATEALMAAYGRDARVRYLRHDRNRGGGAARNTGIRAARAPLVAFLDDDDEWHPDKLARQAERLAEAGPHTALVYCRFDILDAGTGLRRPRKTDGRSHAVRDLIRWNTIGTTSCVMCRTDALHDVGLFDETLRARQDLDLYLRLAQRFEIAFVDETLVTLHVHGDPRISSDPSGSIHAHQLFVRKHRSLIDADPQAVRSLRVQLAKLLQAARRYPEARAELLQVLRHRPTDTEAWMRLALTYAGPRRLAGPVKRARALFRRRPG